MNILVIQTVLPNIELLLLDLKYQQIDNLQWLSEKDEVLKLLPGIEQLLESNNLIFADIKKILVVNGIGGFAATRIGVTVANVLAMVLKAELYEMTLNEKEIDDSDKDRQKIAKIKQTSFDQEGVNNSRNDLGKNQLINPEKDFLKIVQEFFASNPEKVAIAKPIYSADPKISISKKKQFT